MAVVVFYVFLLGIWVMRIFVLSSFSDDVFLRLLRFALSLTLSHGERGRIAESLIMVDFQHHYSLSVEEGTDCRKSDNSRLQHYHSLSLWERVRERAKP